MRDPDERDSAMVQAAHHTLNALRDVGMLDARKALLANLVLELAAVIDKGTRAGRASAVAMAAAQLRETMLVLDPPPEDGDATVEARKRLDAFLAKLEYAANHDGVFPEADQ